MHKKGKIGVGDIVIKKLEDNFTYCRIKSIEVEHTGYTRFEAEDGVNVGMMLDKTRNSNEKYWIYPIISI